LGLILGHNKPNRPVTKNQKGRPEKKTKKLKLQLSGNIKYTTYPTTTDRKSNIQ
jgi:hypothetical protein